MASLQHSALTNADMTILLAPFVNSRAKFIGVFAANNLPKRITYPCSLIVNTDNANLPGQHWVAIYIGIKRNGFFFDSYGFPPYVDSFTSFLNKFCVTWVYNDKSLQHISTFVCGHYCCLFVLACSEGRVREFLNMFDKYDSYSNDAKVILKFSYCFLRNSKLKFANYNKNLYSICNCQTSCSRVNYACAM